MCDQHALRPLPAWIQAQLRPVCAPALGLHERGCQHEQALGGGVLAQVAGGTQVRARP
jgi:hypothetical protein